MKKVFVKKLLLSIMLPVCLISCGNKVINGIEVPELLLIASKKQNINYCKLLNESTKGNTASIRKLALLEISDGAGYEHGAVIVDLIEIIGEDKFIESLATMSKEQKQVVKGFIEAGLEYGNNPNLQTKTFKEAFSKIYDFLNSELPT